MTLSSGSRIALCGAAVLALAACDPAGDDATRGTGPGDEAGPTSNAAAMAGNVSIPTPPDARADDSPASYILAAGRSDLYEIVASELAVDRSDSPAVRAFAHKMIADHTMTSQRLKEAIRQAGLNQVPPSALDTARKGMLTDLTNAQDDQFDAAYLSQQIAAHEDALALHSSYAEAGDQPALRAFAAETAPKIREHLKMVRDLRTK